MMTVILGGIASYLKEMNGSIHDLNLRIGTVISRIDSHEYRIESIEEDLKVKV